VRPRGTIRPNRAPRDRDHRRRERATPSEENVAELWLSDASTGDPSRFIERLSSAAGCDGSSVNNTLVFGSQGRIPATSDRFFLGSTWVAFAFAFLALGGCRRAAPAKNPDLARASPSWAEGFSASRGTPADLVLPAILPAPSTLENGKPATTVAPLVSHGGVLRLLVDAEPSHFNLLLESEASASQIAFGTLYEPLIGCPLPGGSPGAYQPALADRWQLSADGLQLSLHLRPGVRWHDGHLLNVLDIQASLEPFLMTALPASAVLRASLADLSAIELLPERTVRLTLKRPSGYLLRALCDVPILPDHLLRGPSGDPTLLARQPIGTGPFRFVSWERGKRVRLARFADYWGGAALLDEVIFEIDVDGARALARTRRGEVDVLLRVLPLHFPDEVDPVTLHGTFALWRMVPDRWAYVAVNQRHPPLGDAAFRRALSVLWDRPRFAHDLHHGLAHPIMTAPYAAADSPDAARQPAAPPPRAQALADLAAAGYRDSNADGVRDVNGVPIRMSLLVATGSRSAATEAHAFVLAARKAGILVDPMPLDAATVMARVRKGDFDLAMLLWEGRPDEDPAPLFGSSGAFNNFGYRSTEVDALLDSLRLAPGPAARQPILKALCTTLERDQPVLFLYRFDRLLLVDHRVHDLAAAGDRLDLRRTWTDP
jgi:peptide/nickel transport system substrate-binding protein